MSAQDTQTVQTPPVEAPTTPRPERKERPRLDQLPPYRVLLHNDAHNLIEYVVLTVHSLTPLSRLASVRATLEAHRRGIALLCVTHRERAELYCEQFKSCGLTVTAEPAE